MVTAWMRGLLKPGYANGVRSIVRENILLDALDKELQAEGIFKQVELESSLLPLLKPMAVRQNYHNLSNLTKVGTALLQNHKYDTIQHMLKSLRVPSMEETVAAFNLVKNTGVFDELRQTLHEAGRDGLLNPD